MSKFVTELHVKLFDPYANDGTGLWMLTAPFVYYSSLLRREVEAPFGFVHDFASVPRLPLMYSMAGNRYHRPAVIHDYLCRMRRVKRELVDRVFLEAMQLQNREETAWMKNAGIDNDEIATRKAGLEGRAQGMYLAVAGYTKSGLWKSEVDQPEFQPVE
jgi:hypothetical protein